MLGAMLVIFGLTGQTEGGATESVISILLGIALIGWAFWRSLLSGKRP